MLNDQNTAQTEELISKQVLLKLQIRKITHLYLRPTELGEKHIQSIGAQTYVWSISNVDSVSRTARSGATRGHAFEIQSIMLHDRAI